MGHILILRGPKSTGNFGSDFQDALLRACIDSDRPLKIVTIQEISGGSNVRVETRELKVESPRIDENFEAQNPASISKASPDAKIVDETIFPEQKAGHISNYTSQGHSNSQIGTNDALEDHQATLASPSAKTAKNRRKNEAAKKKKAEAKLKGKHEVSDDTMRTAGRIDGKGDNKALNASNAEILSESTAAPSTTTSNALLFEVKNADGKGLGAFAVVDIHKGADVLVEEALINPSEDSYLLREALFMNLSEDKKKSVLTLQSRCSCARVPCIDTPFMKLWIFNCCGDGSFGPYLYELASRFNHDCEPNLARGFSKEKYLIFRAKKDIRKGEELTVNYSMIIGTTETRRRTLLDKFDFDCRCQTCESGKCITVGSVQTSWLQGLQVPKKPTHVANKHTKLDVLERSKVENWYSEMKEAILGKKNELLKAIHIFAFGGDNRVSTFEIREAMITKAMQNIVQFLKQNDKFFVGEAACNLYSDHELVPLTEAIETSYHYYTRPQGQE
ncbi:unnamed protein product [Diplocarpon coronariae]|uniref:SET domain-containing protein n=1 Tax=Diplocarpon coronariae TaxID=2795749 RepID=A0A218YT44_9HELO|nr:hypothetical protein B2J93_8202 [Marssonina coronariae]